MISRLLKLEHLDDRKVDQDERTEAFKMHGSSRKRKPNGRFSQKPESTRGILMQDLAKASPASTALEHAGEDGGADSEDLQMIRNQNSSSSETLYYSFEEHVQFLLGKFSEKFNDWKNSFNRNDRGP